MPRRRYPRQRHAGLLDLGLPPGGGVEVGGVEAVGLGGRTARVLPPGRPQRPLLAMVITLGGVPSSAARQLNPELAGSCPHQAVQLLAAAGF